MSNATPTVQHATAVHLNSEGDDPRQARTELLHLVQQFNNLLDALGSAAFENIGSQEGDLIVLAQGGMLPQQLQPSTPILPTGTILDFFRTIPPLGWLETNGQLINSQNTQHRNLFILLFSLATQSTNPLHGLFASSQDRAAAVNLSAENAWTNGLSMKLPDFRGRTRIGRGEGNGLTSRVFGHKMGSEKVHLLRNHLPRVQLSIKHPWYTNTSSSTRKEIVLKDGKGDVNFSRDTSTTINNRTDAMGNDLAHENMQPSGVILTCIKY